MLNLTIAQLDILDGALNRDLERIEEAAEQGWTTALREEYRAISGTLDALATEREDLERAASRPAAPVVALTPASEWPLGQLDCCGGKAPYHTSRCRLA